jgi:hypothetical protein
MKYKDYYQPKYHTERGARAWNEAYNPEDNLYRNYDDRYDMMDEQDHGYGARPAPDNRYYSEGEYYDPARYDEPGRYGAGRGRGGFFEDPYQGSHPHYNYYESYPSYGQGAPYADHERSWRAGDDQFRDDRYGYNYERDRLMEENRWRKDYERRHHRYHRNRY